jgi:outer membrane immunogenic protein
VKKLLITSAAALALSAVSAFAADLAPLPYVKAPPAPPPPVSWTGCYIDGGVGYGVWDQSHDDYDTTTGLPITQTTNTAGRGWLGRFGGGCDYQVSRFVIGAFADYDFTDLTGTFPSGFGVGSEKETDSWAAGGRVGYLVTPNLLTYFDGGYTQARFGSFSLSTNAVPSVPTAISYPSQTYSGWFLGGGYEYSLGSILPISGLFWRTEYRFDDYNAANVPLLFAGLPTATASHMQKDVQTITSGVVWRFNFGGMGAY